MWHEIFKTIPSAGGLSFFSCMVGSKHNSMTFICLAPQYFVVDASTMRMVTKQKQRTGQKDAWRL